MNKKDAAAIVEAARANTKVSARELLEMIFDDFYELHGDRVMEDDPAMIGGLAFFKGQPITVIATDKGSNPRERMDRHFGCPTPAGYRKARRLMKQAEKFNRPVVIFVNTAGAYAGMEAEEEGQGYSIAQNLQVMSTLKTPLITIITGEGGSGGALALAGGDQVWMLENSIYSVISPEAFASILWKDGSRSAEAAEVLKISPTDLLEHQMIEGIIPEFDDHRKTCAEIADVLSKQLTSLCSMSIDKLLEKRHARFRKY